MDLGLQTPAKEGPAYAELVASTNFSFLRAASHPFEIVGQAAGLGLSRVGICDRINLSGVVRAYSAARELRYDHHDFKFVAGARLVLSDDTPDIAVYPIDRNS